MRIGRGKWIVILQQMQTCGNCDKWFENLKEISKHKELYQCQSIHLLKKSNIEVKSLEESNPKEDNFSKKHKCDYCQRYFSRKSHLNDHKRRIHGDFGEILGEYLCEQCNKMFFNEDSLKKHVAQKHYVLPTRPPTCDTCNKVFTETSSLQKHMAKIHLKTAKKFHCDICCKVFYDTSHLKRHKEATHQEIKHKCSSCDKEYNAKADLDNHFNMVHANKPKYQCDKCNRPFLTSRNLKKHKASRHEGKKYKCNQCEKELSSDELLKKHIETIHDKKERFECDKCGMLFKSLEKFQHHEKMNKHDTFECPECDKVYFVKQNLKAHILSAHMPNKNKCELCDKSFTFAKSLKDHLKMVHDGFKFECDECDVKLCSKSYIEKHKLKYHPQKDEKS